MKIILLQNQDNFTAVAQQWWERLSPNQQKKYLARHPRSKKSSKRGRGVTKTVQRKLKPSLKPKTRRKKPTIKKPRVKKEKIQKPESEKELKEKIEKLEEMEKELEEEQKQPSRDKGLPVKKGVRSFKSIKKYAAKAIRPIKERLLNRMTKRQVNHGVEVIKESITKPEESSPIKKRIAHRFLGKIGLTAMGLLAGAALVTPFAPLGVELGKMFLEDLNKSKKERTTASDYMEKKLNTENSDLKVDDIIYKMVRWLSEKDKDELLVDLHRMKKGIYRDNVYEE